MTLDQRGPIPRSGPPRPIALSDRGLDDPERLADWWSRLSRPARAAFADNPDAPIPAAYLDEVMAGGVRIVGRQAGGLSIEWHFAAEARDFIARQH